MGAFYAAPVAGRVSHPPPRVGAPVGAVLAGGRGSRLGGAKATATLAGRPLLAWTLDSVCAALERVVVVVKDETLLPPVPDRVEVWRESSPRCHPLVGVLEALRRARGRAVVICAVDLPLVPAAVIELLASTSADGARAVIAGAAGRVQPLLARYEPSAAAALRRAPPRAPLTTTVMSLDPRVVSVDEGVLVNVNTPADMLAAERLLARDQPTGRPGSRRSTADRSARL